MKLTLRLALIALLVVLLGTLVVVYLSQEETTHYRGDRKNGLPHGFGIMERPGGAYYAGHFQEGERHGRGTWIHPEGIKYAGMWEHDIYHGRGTLFLPNGDRYDGQWDRGQKHGPGIYRWAEGATYTGFWSLDKQEGYGILEKPDGYIYRGQWLNNKRQGEGTAFYTDGSEYHGEWLNDERHGEGTLLFADGSVYEGSWAGDEKHGQGTLTCPEGSVKTATWVEGEMQEIRLESISVTPGSLSLVEGGDSALLEVDFKPEGALEEDLEWESSSPGVAEVEEGEVRPINAGSATITVSTVDGEHEATCDVTVRATAVGITGISLDRSSITMQVGETAYLIASTRPAGATDVTLNWSSSNPSTASVHRETTRRGRVEAQETGETWVSVTTADGRHSAGCRITVIPREDPADRVIVPRLIGQPIEKAHEMIVTAGFYLGHVSFEHHHSAPEDQVISQTPAVGASANKGSAVHLVLSKGPFPEEQEEEETEAGEPGEDNDQLGPEEAEDEVSE